MLLLVLHDNGQTGVGHTLLTERIVYATEPAQTDLDLDLDRRHFAQIFKVHAVEMLEHEHARVARVHTLGAFVRVWQKTIFFCATSGQNGVKLCFSRRGTVCCPYVVIKSAVRS